MCFLAKLRNWILNAIRIAFALLNWYWICYKPTNRFECFLEKLALQHSNVQYSSYSYAHFRKICHRRNKFFQMFISEFLQSVTLREGCILNFTKASTSQCFEERQISPKFLPLQWCVTNRGYAHDQWRPYKSNRHI